MTRRNILHSSFVALALLVLLALFFWPVILGGRTLLPLDNLFAFEPWQSFAGDFGITVPHNELLSDLILENYVWKRFVVQALRNRQLPLWNPYILSGQPFLAAGQHSALYPLSLLFYLLPLTAAYGWFTVLQLSLAGLFMYAYARTIRLDRVASVIAGLVYTFSGFMVVSVVHPMIIAAASWLPLLLAVVERLLLTQEASQAEQERRPVSYIPWIVLGASALGMQFLAGHIEIAYYVVLVTLFYAGCRLGVWWWRHRSWVQLCKMAVSVALIIVLGVGLAAVQLVPLYDLVRDNFRQGSATYQQIIGWAYPWRRAVAFLMPDFFGNPSHHSYFDVFSRQTVAALRNAQGQPIQTIYWEVKNYVEGGSYVGLLPLLLSLVAAWKARTRHVWIFVVLAIISLCFVFGTPLYAILYYLFPGIKQLHSPFRWVFPYTLSISVLAGCGASWLASNRAKEPNRFGRLLGGPVLALGVLGLTALAVSLCFPDEVAVAAQRIMLRLAQAPEAFADGRAFYAYQVRNLLIVFLAMCGAGLTLWLSGTGWQLPAHPFLRRLTGAAGISLWQVLSLVVILAELFAIGRGFNPAADPAILGFEPPVVAFLQQDGGLWRFSSFDAPHEKTFNANSGMLYDLADIRGYDSIISQQYVDYMRLIEPQAELLYNRIAAIHNASSLDSPLLDLLNVKYILTTQTIDRANYTLVYDAELRVYRNEDCLPRAFIVHQALIAPDATARQEALQGLDPHCAVILEEMPEEEVPVGQCNAFTPASIVRYDLNEVIIEAQLERSGYLVLADNYSSGWRAYDTRPGLEEREIPLYRANGTFRAVALSPGQHTVRFRYTPFSFKLGLFVSFIAAVALVLLLGYSLWRRHYHPGGEESSVRRVAKNALTPMVLSLVNRIIDMAFAMLYLRLLAPVGAGRYQFATNFIGYFETAILFGLGTLITREMAKHRDQANRHLSNSIALRLLLWLASLPVLGAALYAYTRWAGLTRDTLLAILFFAVALIPEMFSDSLSAVFYANEKMEYPAAISSVTTILRVVLGTMVLLLGFGFVGMAATSLLVNLSTALILGVLAARMFFRPQVEFDPAFGRAMARQSWPLMVNNLLAKVFFQVDVLLLKPIRGDTEVGYYSAAYRYIRGLDIIPSYFTMAIFPLISRFAESQRESLVRAYVLSVKLLVLVALPIAVGTTFIARELILILAGPAYVQQSTLALQVLVWYMPIGFINSVTQYVLIAMNQQRFLTRAFILGAVFNILTNLLLIPRYGYLAAAAVTVLSEAALLLPFYYCVRKNLTTLPWLDLFWRPVVAASLMAVLLWFLRDTTIVLTVPLSGAVYSAAIVALGTFRQPDVAVVLDLVPARISRWLPFLSPEP